MQLAGKTVLLAGATGGSGQAIGAPPTGNPSACPTMWERRVKAITNSATTRGEDNAITGH